MKICQLAAVDFTIYHFLLPLMEGMRHAGHEVVAVCSKEELGHKIQDKKFRLETIDFHRSYNLIQHCRAYNQLVDLFQREKFDIVHVHTPIAALVGRLAASRAGVPMIVYTAHGFYFHEHQPFWLRSAFIFLEWIGGRYTDILFTQAEEDAATGRRLKLCRGNIVQAIGNGVNSERFSSNSITEASRRALRSEQGATDKDVIILMVGRLVAEKGYCELLKAIESVDAHLWVIGSRLESDHASSIDNAIQKVRVDPALSARIKFLGYRDDVDKLMGAVDIFTLPSHREGMPRSIIEAMMSGLPVVATDIRGSREEVIHDTTGLLVPLKDSDQLAAALNQLVRNKSQRHQMGKAGKIRALDLYDENIVIDRQLHALGLK